MIRVFTTFSGYDSQCVALERLGLEYELVGWSEIDKYAIDAHNALFPQYAERNYGDIRSIDWSQVPDFDLFTYSSPCFVAGTLVLTDRGYIPIEDVKVGDKVLTHQNRYQKVLRAGHKMSSDLYKIKGMAFDVLSVLEIIRSTQGKCTDAGTKASVRSGNPNGYLQKTLTKRHTVQ